MNGQSVDRLMDIILQMKINLSHITDTLQQQTSEIRDQLGVVFNDEKLTLERCLKVMDEKLADCSQCIHDYQRLYAGLAAMREKLVQLGGEPGSMPPELPADGIQEIIAWRLSELRSRGKL